MQNVVINSNSKLGTNATHSLAPSFDTSNAPASIADSQSLRAIGRLPVCFSNLNQTIFTSTAQIVNKSSQPGIIAGDNSKKSYTITLKLSNDRLRKSRRLRYGILAFEQVIRPRSAIPPVEVRSKELRGATPIENEGLWAKHNELDPDDKRYPVVMAPGVSCQCRDLGPAAVKASEGYDGHIC